MASLSTGALADRNTAKRLPSRIIGVSKKRQQNNDRAIAIPMQVKRIGSSAQSGAPGNLLTSDDAVKNTIGWIR